MKKAKTAKSKKPTAVAAAEYDEARNTLAFAHLRAAIVNLITALENNTAALNEQTRLAAHPEPEPTEDTPIDDGDVAHEEEQR